MYVFEFLRQTNMGAFSPVLEPSAHRADGSPIASGSGSASLPAGSVAGRPQFCAKQRTDVEPLKARIAELEAEVQRLRAALASRQPAHDATLEAENTALRQTLAQANAKIAALETAATAL
jgi:hypothetical protein